MSENRPEDTCTRRAVLLLAGAAIPALAQSQTAAKAAGHPVVHFEIGCTDVTRTERFFSALFGWKIGPGSTIDAAGGPGIPGHITSLGHEPKFYTTFYVEVDDVKAALDKAVSLGGKTLVPPIKIPTGTFAWFADLDGNTVGLLKRNS